MNLRNEGFPGKQAPEPDLPHAEEALRAIEEYANGLREIIKKLRRKLN